MDNFTKYVILIPLRNKESETTARALFYDVFMTHGFPAKILSDNGQEFMSGMRQQLWKLLDIHKVTTAPYHPQSDGKNENSHKFIFKIIKILCENNLRVRKGGTV